jgi:hypothetical protein
MISIAVKRPNIDAVGLLKSFWVPTYRTDPISR